MRHEERASKMKHWTQDALMSAALGELAPARDAELCTHIAECVVCRDALRSARAACAAVSAGLELLVASAPTSQFEARLRARLAAEPESSRALLAWMHWAPVAVGAITVAAVLLFVLHAHTPSHADPNAIPLLAIHVQPGLVPELGQKPPSRPTPATRRAPSNRTPHRAPARPAEPEVLVEPDQFAAIMRYTVGLGSDGMKDAQLTDTQQVFATPLEIKPLEIKPVDIAPLENSDSQASNETALESSRP
jgi:negative regulator of sigma E activity